MVVVVVELFSLVGDESGRCYIVVLRWDRMESLGLC